MRPFRLIGRFVQASIQEQAAYRFNFGLHLFTSVLTLGAGLLGLQVLYGQVAHVNGWDATGALAVLGVYLLVGALRGLVIEPSLASLGGMDGEVWQGAFDFTLLRPAPLQFLVSVRKWRIAALLDVALALVVLGAAVLQMPARPAPGDVAAFAVALAAGMGVVYALLLTTTALVFWSPGLMSMWVFDGVFQLARYPLGLYPSWLQLALTWVVPVGLITTVPAEALRGRLEVPQLALLLALAVALTIGASLVFRAALRRYASASS